VTTRMEEIEAKLDAFATAVVAHVTASHLVSRTPQERTRDEARAALLASVRALAAPSPAPREATGRLPEAPGTPLRDLIDRSYRYMKRRDDGEGWDGAEGIVREAFRLGYSYVAASPAPAQRDATAACGMCGGTGWRVLAGGKGSTTRCSRCTPGPREPIPPALLADLRARVVGRELGASPEVCLDVGRAYLASEPAASPSPSGNPGKEPNDV
jgi:hypothetical protein